MIAARERMFVIAAVVALWSGPGVLTASAFAAVNDAAYTVTVVTGDRTDAGTNAGVLVTFGSGAVPSDPGGCRAFPSHLLDDPTRDDFERGATDTFTGLYDRGLSELPWICLSLDNLADRPSWFVDTVIVRSENTSQRWQFSAFQWLAVDRTPFTTIAVIPETTVSVELSTSAALLGDTVTLKVVAANVRDLFGFQFDVEFDPAVLRLTAIREGGFLSTAGVTAFAGGRTGNPVGTVRFTANTLVGPVSGVSGGGTLAEMQLRTVGRGVSPVKISNTLLLDSTLADIQASLVDAEVRVGDDVPCEQALDSPLLDLAATATSLLPSPVGGGAAGRFIIDAALTNQSGVVIGEPLTLVVETLTGGNRLLSATSGNQSAASRQAVLPGKPTAAPNQAARTTIDPGETVQIRLEVGLASRRPFVLLVDVRGCLVGAEESR